MLNSFDIKIEFIILKLLFLCMIFFYFCFLLVNVNKYSVLFRFLVDIGDFIFLEVNVLSLIF